MFFAGQLVDLGSSAPGGAVSALVLVVNAPAYPDLGWLLGRYYLFHMKRGGVTGAGSSRPTISTLSPTFRRSRGLSEPWGRIRF
jgi:hypothetical protein